MNEINAFFSNTERYLYNIGDIITYYICSFEYILSLYYTIHFKIYLQIVDQ